MPIHLTDDAGILRPLADRVVTVEVTGAGTLLGLGSGQPICDEGFSSGRHSTYYGRALAVIRAGHEAGDITVTVAAPAVIPSLPPSPWLSRDPAGAPDRGPSPPGSADRRLGARLAAPHRPSVAGAAGGAAGRSRPERDPSCYLCPGNPRAGGELTPDYVDTFVFDNDFPALLPVDDQAMASTVSCTPFPSVGSVVSCATRRVRSDAGAALDAGGRRGDPRGGSTSTSSWGPRLGRPRADLREPRLDDGSEQPPSARPDLGPGAPPGRAPVSCPRSAPIGPTGTCLLCDYVAAELATGERIVFADPHHVVVVPFWATWPFEVLLLPRRHCGALPEQSEAEHASLAEALTALARCYDSLFGVVFPYSMGLHQRPTDGQPHDEWHLHTHFYPPLLRSASIRKFMVGYELLCEPQRDITPEVAAASLRGSWTG